MYRCKTLNLALKFFRSGAPYICALASFNKYIKCCGKIFPMYSVQNHPVDNMSQDSDYQIDEFGMMRHYSQKLKIDEPAVSAPSEPREVQNSLSIPEVCVHYFHIYFRGKNFFVGHLVSHLFHRSIFCSHLGNHQSATDKRWTHCAYRMFVY